MFIVQFKLVSAFIVFFLKLNKVCFCVCICELYIIQYVAFFCVCGRIEIVDIYIKYRLGQQNVPTLQSKEGSGWWKCMRMKLCLCGCDILRWITANHIKSFCFKLYAAATRITCTRYETFIALMILIYDVVNRKSCMRWIYYKVNTPHIPTIRITYTSSNKNICTACV